MKSTQTNLKTESIECGLLLADTAIEISVLKGFIRIGIIISKAKFKNGYIYWKDGSLIPAVKNVFRETVGISEKQSAKTREALISLTELWLYFCQPKAAGRNLADEQFFKL